MRNLVLQMKKQMGRVFCLFTFSLISFIESDLEDSEIYQNTPVICSMCFLYKNNPLR
jgi:hypothetical protein